MLQSFKDVLQHIIRHTKWTWSTPPPKKYTDAAAHFQLYLKNKNMSSLNTHASSRSDHSLHHRALDHPEILERIFGFLSQCTLRTNVRLVCVHWNSVARPFITLTVWWYNYNESTHDLFPLYSYFNKLSLGFHPFTLRDQLEIKHFQEGEPGVQKRWTALFENVQTLTQQGQLHFRILKVSHPYKIKDRLLPLLGVLASVLTELDIYLVRDSVLHLGPIMETCYHLKTLLVEGSKSDKHPYGMATLLKDGDSPHINNHRRSSGHDSDPQETSRYITRLCIGRVRVHQLDLEAIIRRCPNLWVLDLEVAIYPRTTRAEDTFFPSSSSAFVYNPIIAPSVDPKPLIHFVRAHCRRLARFLCIPLNQSCSSMWRHVADMITVSSCGTVSSSLMMPGAGATWKRVRTHVPHFAWLTTLRIQRALATPQILHIILCTAPLLLEVVAPEAQYPSGHFFPPDASLPSKVAKDVDSETLQQRPEFDPASFSTTLPELINSDRCSREVWACRGLRILNLGIDAVEFGYIGTSARHEHLLAMARMTYAYLVRVCPLLSELSLSRTDGLWPGLEGGLCLLSGLVHLELIEIQTRLLYVPRERDWDWLGGDRAYPCKLSCDGEDNEVTPGGRGSWKQSEQRGRGDIAESDGLVDRGGLVGKWSLQEVKDVRSRLLGSGEQVWPRLTYLGIWFCASSSCTLSVESKETLEHIRKVVQDLRPAIQFICKPLPP